MSIQYLQPTKDDWAWFIPRYGKTAWESMRVHRQNLTSIEEVQANLEKQIERFCGSDTLENIAYVARGDDGERIGFIWLIESTSGFTAAAFAWIMCVYVEAGFRGKGIGRKLMELGEEWAGERGLIDIILNVSNENEVRYGCTSQWGMRLKPNVTSKSWRVIKDEEPTHCKATFVPVWVICFWQCSRHCVP